MVLYFENKHRFNFDFETASLAFINRYPNPYSQHVLSVDTLESYVDKQGRLCTTRVIVKTGKLPKFIKPFLGVTNLNSWIIEKSIINPRTNTLLSYTSNIDHRKFIRVEEYLMYHSENEESGGVVGVGTIVDSKVKFSSNLFGLKSKIEEWSHKRFMKNIQNTREGLNFVMMKVKERGRNYLTKGKTTIDM
ncbi:hypothetical protein KGF57_003129 [Candida theae]|uniref:PRELI/MSF1 domain-containing protein n=1 Tax=Candida theae TaxID=1198502 RepID=A0AAD5FYD5_9ASCO|nr:uncharacterized protein KGF57_003129 [Candida theae]KAI5957862.1 hypothetical protein KGF57_003129 [Candida theae]